MMQDPNNGNNKLIVELKPCTKCCNPFMVKQGEVKSGQELICDNCLKLDQHKKELSIGVIDDCILNQKEMEVSIKEMKENLTVSKGQFNKQAFLEKIRKRSQALTKSIELLQKIDESKDEILVDEYKQLFERMKLVRNGRINTEGV